MYLKIYHQYFANTNQELMTLNEIFKEVESYKKKIYLWVLNLKLLFKKKGILNLVYPHFKCTQNKINNTPFIISPQSVTMSLYLTSYPSQLLIATIFINPICHE